MSLKQYFIQRKKVLFTIVHKSFCLQNDGSKSSKLVTIFSVTYFENFKVAPFLYHWPCKVCIVVTYSDECGLNIIQSANY